MPAESVILPGPACGNGLRNGIDSRLEIGNSWPKISNQRLSVAQKTKE
jgi:hypothetical protein